MQRAWPSLSWCRSSSDPVLRDLVDAEASPAALAASHRGEASSPTRRLALVLEYEGTGYKGFQRQARDPSIQEALETAINCLTREATRVRGASRTDAGAHAKGQVIDFLTQAGYSTETFQKALNQYLPPDIKVKEAYCTPGNFNSRKDAASRVYCYTVSNTRWPTALLRDFSHWISAPLDVERMREGASYLLGSHDISALAATLPPGKSAVRRIDRWDVWRRGELVLIECEANGFLPHQIRRTNGILVKIGLGRMSVQVIKEIIDGTIKELKNCPSLPAKGLCLMKVKYPNLPCSTQDGYETD